MPASDPVLLIEDDPDVRAAMAQVLTGAGFRVFASDEGSKALELADAAHPVLVLLDLVMPGMSGWEFLERSRAVPALARVPVVVVTGSPSAPPREAAAILRKPVDVATLVRTIRRLARRLPDA